MTKIDNVPERLSDDGSSGSLVQAQWHDINHTSRVVILLNKNLQTGVALNAAAHLGMAIANLVGEEGRAKLKFLDFVDAEKGVHPSISARSLIVLRGTSSEIRKLRQEALRAGLRTADFTNTMTGQTYREQLERTATTSEATLEYFGVALFGSAETISPLTKRHSLWK
jgi:hypothetical protein